MSQFMIALDQLVNTVFNGCAAGLHRGTSWVVK
jgi:hypothetical protein